MKAISLWQPWAMLVAIGAKWIETRHWKTNHRGDLLIHAAKRHSQEQIDFMLSEPCRSILKIHGIKPEMRDAGSCHADQLPLGALLAVRNLADCKIIPVEQCFYRASWACGKRSTEWMCPPVGSELHFGNYEPGRWAWRFVEGQRLHCPIPYRGAQGFFEVPDAVVCDGMSQVS
jgi:hypothetical protein